MIYQWKPGTRLKSDAQAAGERLEKLRLKAGDYFSPELVVADAKRTTSPLHADFEWDVVKAANQCWISQAKYLIRHLAVVETHPTGEQVLVHAFVSVRPQEDTGPRYTSIRHAMADPELREQIREQARRDLESWRHRYEGFEEFAEIYSAIDSVIAQPA